MTGNDSGNASFERTAELAREEQPFAVVTVVRTESPTSARAGNRAVILPDGTIEGWLGGGCITPTACEEALLALKTGEPRFIRVTPDESPTPPGIRVVRMTCTSEGSVDLYVEPFLPRPTLFVAGDSPVTKTLAAIAGPLGFRFAAFDSDEAMEIPNPSDAWMVVTTFGGYDEDAVEAGLRLGLPYIGLVASERRGGSVLSELRARGYTDEELDAVKSPAGIPLNASGDSGLALSIISEVVSLRAERHPVLARQVENLAPEKALDPICSMAVEIENARHVTRHEETDYYFCCAGCLREFESSPDKYAATA